MLPYTRPNRARQSSEVTRPAQGSGAPPWPPSERCPRPPCPPAGPRPAPRSPHLLLPLGADAAAVLPHHVLPAQLPQKLRGLRGTSEVRAPGRPGALPSEDSWHVLTAGPLLKRHPHDLDNPCVPESLLSKELILHGPAPIPPLREPSRFFSGHKIISTPPPH